ncbi:MAG: cytochrome c maturation protein CcmE [Cyclobacteriaceae bacterium]|nr:cytochrome c maturation protein CcmE [Cyclobacteriaceae bacterium]
MKKSHIFGIVIIAIAIGVIVSTAGNASSYVTFSEARSIADSGSKAKIHVVGTLKKNDQSEIIGIEPSPDMLSFKFIMLDENRNEQVVLHANPIPQDFEKSEQVVVVGSYHNDMFIADKILLKCPSKYQEEEIKI